MSIRRDRRANYGESYLDDEHIAMYFIMRNKLRRYVQQLDVSVGDNGDVTEVFKDIDKAYDSILDLAVFALFEMDKMRRKMPG